MTKHNADLDAVVVGSGPNGLAAAISVARAGYRVLVLEAEPTLGGGARSAELTLPGFVHDRCSAIHPLAVGSPFFRSLPLERYGLEWIQPDLPLAHPLDTGTAAVLQRSLHETCEAFGQDGRLYGRLLAPLVQRWPMLADEILQPPVHLPRHPFLLGRFGLLGLQSAIGLGRRIFDHEPGRALLAGLAAHSFLPLEALGSASFALMLGIAGHAVGWPLPRGGAQKISDSLAAYLRALNGEIETNRRVSNIRDIPSARAVFLDLTAWQIARIFAGQLRAGYRKQLASFPHSPSVFKIDYALNAPIPWAAEHCNRAGTVHIGGSMADVATSERAVASGRVPERPFVLLAQQSLFDATRAPAGKYTAWAYCHVPRGCTIDMTALRAYLGRPLKIGRIG